MHAFPFAAAALVCASAAVAQEQSASVREVLARNAELEAAIAKGDAALIGRFFGDEFRLHNSASRILNREQVLAQFRSGATRFSSYERTIDVAYEAGDVVVLMGSERVTPAGGTQATRRFTSVWRRTSLGWRQIARQSTDILVKP